MTTNTEIRQMDSLELAYISHKGKMEAIGHVCDRLVKWATPKSFIGKATRILTIYNDSPKITGLNKIRVSACIVLNETLKVGGEVNLRKIKPVKCIVSRLEITPNEFQ